ncbi:MAG: glycosyltransferase [Myxococcota bacterium]
MSSHGTNPEEKRKKGTGRGTRKGKGKKSGKKAARNRAQKRKNRRPALTGIELCRAYFADGSQKAKLERPFRSWLASLENDRDAFDAFRTDFNRYDWVLFERLFVASALLGHGKSPAFLELCADQLPAASKPAFFNSLVGLLRRQAWMLASEDPSFDRGEFLVRRVWPAHLEFLDRHVRRPRAESDARLSTGKPRAAVVIPHLLNLRHSPTRIGFEYARAMATGGYEVLVVDAGLLPQRVEAPLFNPLIARYNDTLCAQGTLQFDGVALPFVRVGDASFTVEKVQQAVDIIDRFSPNVVLSYGNLNLVGDCLAAAYPTVFIPAARQAALSLAQVLLYPKRSSADAPPPETAERMTGTYHPYSFMPMRYPRSAATTRSELGLPDGVLFAISGTRLDREMTDLFVETMRRLLEASSAELVLIGGHYHGRLESALPQFGPRIHQLGFQPHLRDTLRVFDGYLNPFRDGGGTTAFLAMVEGLPVVSLRRGDALNYLGPELTAETPDEYLAQATALANDPAERRAAALRIKAQADRIPFLTDAFGQLEEACHLATSQLRAA